VWLDADRLDPENREFRHPDPVRWTDDNRAKILAALYTILLGNPTLDKPREAQMNTRFKMWWRVVGSAVEQAAKLCADEPGAQWEHLEADEPAAKGKPTAIDFQEIFLNQEEDEEQGETLGHALDIMRRRLNTPFMTKNVVEFLNKIDHQPEIMPDVVALRSFFYPGAPTNQMAVPESVGWKLRSHVGDAVLYEGGTLTLKRIERPTGHKGGQSYYISTTSKGRGDGES